MGVLTPLLDAFKEYVKDKRYAYIAAPLCTLLSVYGAAILVVAAAALLVVRHLSPHRVSTIRIIFLDDPTPHIDKGALAYLVYEINRMQREWYFEVAFDEFNPNSLTSAEEKQFGGPDQK